MVDKAILQDLKAINDSANRLWARTGAYEALLFAIIKTYPAQDLERLQSELSTGLEILKANFLAASPSEPAMQELDATAARLLERCQLVQMQHKLRADS